MKYQWSQLFQCGNLHVEPAHIAHLSFTKDIILCSSTMKLQVPTTCSGMRSWAVEDTFHPLQFLDIRGFHIPQSMAEANLILRSIEMTLEGELSAPLGAVAWWCCKFSSWTFLSQKHQQKISGLYFGKTDELEHLFSLLWLPGMRWKMGLPWPMSSGCGTSKQRVHRYSCR